jgi:hypothetical protein
MCGAFAIGGATSAILGGAECRHNRADHLRLRRALRHKRGSNRPGSEGRRVEAAHLSGTAALVGFWKVVSKVPARRKHVQPDIKTPKEKLLMEALLDPRNKGLTVEAFCKKAGIGKTRYYECIADQKFVEEYKQRALELAHHSIGPVINAFIEQATQNGSYQHGKVLLEMTGMHNDKMSLSISPVRFSGEDDLTD